MWPRRTKGKQRYEWGTTAVAERPSNASPDDLEELRAELEVLTESNRARRDLDNDRRLMHLSHLAGIRMLTTDRVRPEFTSPDVDALPHGDPLPEIAGKDLTAGLIRAGILRDGCLLVRGLVPREDALRFASQIDRAVEERERWQAGGTARDGYYEEFTPEPPFLPVEVRPWIENGGGLLAADSPVLSFEMLEMFRGAGLPQIVAGYLGEPALISVHKTTLRKAEPSVPGAWHQDGFFMGDVRSLNLWLSLSRCGDQAPGLDIVPRRLDKYLSAGAEGAVHDIAITQALVEQAAGDTPIIRPIFEPGDALFFDELFLHQTGSDPSMPHPRFAVENWFFGGSAFPGEYAPLAV